MARRKRKEDERAEMTEGHGSEEEFEDDEDEPADEEDLAPHEVEETTDLVTVAQARNMKEARAMKSILESAEITAFIGQEDTSLEAGGTGGHGIPVLVPEAMAADAEDILAEAAMSADDEAEDEGYEDDDWDLDEDDDEEDDDYFDDDLEELEDDEDEDEDEDDLEFNDSDER